MIKKKKKRKQKAWAFKVKNKLSRDMNSGLEAEKFQVIIDLGREHIRNLITIHIESKAKKK